MNPHQPDQDQANAAQSAPGAQGGPPHSPAGEGGPPEQGTANLEDEGKPSSFILSNSQNTYKNTYTYTRRNQELGSFSRNSVENSPFLPVSLVDYPDSPGYSPQSPVQDSRSSPEEPRTRNYPQLFPKLARFGLLVENPVSLARSPGPFLEPDSGARIRKLPPPHFSPPNLPSRIPQELDRNSGTGPGPFPAGSKSIFAPKKPSALLPPHLKLTLPLKPHNFYPESPEKYPTLPHPICPVESPRNWTGIRTRIPVPFRLDLNPFWHPKKSPLSPHPLLKPVS